MPDLDSVARQRARRRARRFVRLGRSAMAERVLEPTGRTGPERTEPIVPELMAVIGLGLMAVIDRRRPWRRRLQR